MSRIVERISHTTILLIAAAMLAFIVGFAYGNFFEVQYGFQLRDWQTLASVAVAVAAAVLAYIGVHNTQRINVMIKEQDRIDGLLPGLRQVNELLLVIRGPLHSLQPQHRYQAQVLLDTVIRMQSSESVEDAVRRQLPLADPHLRWEVAEIVFGLKSQATILKVGHEELHRYQTEVANIHTFAASSHQGLLEMTARVKNSYERENDKMAKAIRALDDFAETIKRRMAKAEARQVIIRGVVDRFFKAGHKRVLGR